MLPFDEFFDQKQEFYKILQKNLSNHNMKFHKTQGNVRCQNFWPNFQLQVSIHSRKFVISSKSKYKRFNLTGLVGFSKWYQRWFLSE